MVAPEKVLIISDRISPSISPAHLFRLD